MEEIQCTALVADSAEKGFDLEPRTVTRPFDPSGTDIVIKLHYSGHTDLHQLINDFGLSSYPCTPGHEGIGTVERVGRSTSRFQVGDLAGVGYIFASCGQCRACKEDGTEQYCEGGKNSLAALPDYSSSCNGIVRYPENSAGLSDGDVIKGTFSSHIVINERYAVRMPKSLAKDNESLAKSAPLLCAGITLYDPLKFHNVQKGTKVAICGLGGLGYLGIRYAKARGAHVTVLSSSPQKQEVAQSAGADDFCLYADEYEINKRARSIDIVLDTVSAKHDVTGVVNNMLRFNGTYVLLGLTHGLDFSGSTNFMIFGRKKIIGNVVGSIANHEEAVKVAVDNNFASEYKVVQPNQVKNVLSELYEKNKSGLRYVIDLSSLHKS